MEVKALITAAGLGKRFGVLTRNTNKCLFVVEGQSLLAHLLDRLKGAGIRQTVVVTGHQHERLRRILGRRARTVFNPFYKVSGILGSFWASRPFLDGRPFIFTTSDHFFHPSVLRDCLSKRAELVIVVQKKKAYTKEDAKVIIKNSRVVMLGKTLPVRSADGEFGGMAYFGPRASRYFFTELQTHLEKGDPGGYMMDILVTLSRKYGIPIRYTTCGEQARIEVDSVPDLIQARRMAQSFKRRKP